MLKYIFFSLIFLFGTFFHIITALKYNTILTIPDSFAYIQMANYLKDGILEGFGTGWFGFFYSIFLALGQFFTTDGFLAGKIINIILFNISGVVLLFIGKRYLSFYHNMLLIALFFFSPVLLHYNIHILSENVFILLFLLLVLFMHRLLEAPDFVNSLAVGFFLAAMYLTRSEAFIYIVPIILSLFVFAIKKELLWEKALLSSFIILVSFSLFIAPYIYYLHTITGEWGLTNKGSSNIRQAMMRGTETMDDEGFERAVGELTEDKHHFIAGFAGGLKYEKPAEEYDVKAFLLDNKDETLYRFGINQKKLFTQIIPIMISGDVIRMYYDSNFIGYIKPFALFLSIIPLFFFVFGFFRFLIRKHNILLTIGFPLFLFALLFFTLFFVLERYFIIFLPFFLLILVYGVQEFFSFIEEIQTGKFILITGMIGVSYYMGIFYFLINLDDSPYEVKKIAGERIRENETLIETENNSLRIMERFPITTYYAGVNERWLTPYVEQVNDLIDYAKYNKIDLLVVDTLDFRKYRKQINILLSDKFRYNGLKLIKEFEENDEKVLLYQFNF